ncbi:hypothetical protein F5X68DRAFT_199562 [Plectosphaerella plurivora]|uniref:DUF1682-domain-containing protein n=1 Tax=Plectosphaerella plurivora TaxID=936078 RepID=A0A9P8VJ05_9PEZI|nr:hypothetical protein F5X68DRAFT_199562 [Plectosphaerella plurivora]
MGFFGGKAAETPIAGGDSDFADVVEAPEPVPIDTVVPQANTFTGPASAPSNVPFGRWWAIHERHSLNEFKMEGAIIAISLVVFLIHLVGASMNRKKAKKWAVAHAPVLRSEFASVGFNARPTPDEAPAAEQSIREKSLFEFSSYATGRQNVAFVDVDLTLIKRFNPMISISEAVISFFWESNPTPRDFMDATIFPFDGKESLSVPAAPGAHELRSKDNKSTYDGFVWAIVAKERMKQTREDRYDLSLTFTKDHAKLPNWLSVMSESAEITDLLLTPEIIKAVEEAGDNFDYLIISDQPVEKPRTLEEANNSRKRVFLRYGLPSNNDYSKLTPLFDYAVRLPDTLVSVGKLRPEITRKLNKVRDEQSSQLRKEADALVAEERAAERERAKKAKRDQELASLDAKAQKKFLDKEREKEQKKMAKKQTMRG